MDKRKALKLAQLYASIIRTRFDCKDIYLFGSYARGTFHDESDIDIAVILGDFDNSVDMQVRLMKLRRDIDSRIEPHPIREKDFNEFHPLAHDILTHGLRITSLSHLGSDLSGY